MSNIQVYSDIHNEIRRYYKIKPWTPPNPDKDAVLILAGDIDLAKNVSTYMSTICHLYKYIIHVAGNHEYYGSNMVSADRKMKENLPPNCFHLAHGESLVLDGQHYFGGTMWTDLAKDVLKAIQASRAMNDYRKIRWGKGSYRRITPFDTSTLHRNFIHKYMREVTKDTIVITHHSPLLKSTLSPVDSHVGDLDAAYHAGLEWLVLDQPPKIWISGHTHSRYVQEWEGVTFITNCLGYPGEIPLEIL